MTLTTAARVVLPLIEADHGRITFDGEDVLAASPARMRALRRRMQNVFQDPASARDAKPFRFDRFAQGRWPRDA